MKRISLLSSAFLVITLVGSTAHSGERSATGVDFGSNWTNGWREKSLAETPTRYIVVEDNGRRVLMALSRSSASALWTPFEHQLDEGTELSWRWKVTRGLSTNMEERTKAGDDYAARVLVAFDPDPFSKNARVLCYVWANEEPVGAIYESPHSRNVATVVVRSEHGEGNWVSESRNVVEDYRRAFGEIPSKSLCPLPS